MDLQIIQNKVFVIRGSRVMLDYDLADMYEIETKVLKQAVRRNMNRFPADFMFELTQKEYQSLRSQNVTIEIGRGTHSKYLPFAFTEQGVAMLSSVLKSTKALEVNITIMRAFVTMRQNYLDSAELRQRIEAIETEMETKFEDIHQALQYLLDPPQPAREPIGFKPGE
ncbi:ORF6N domain-containing protein [Dyadobacter crusticola]|uniref:ORF6N domain-containing protein n=1 Tax=Dyadobacter crusticola TaxID=292407 RepID=UPI0004E201A7|nr:ORF6N domain-containing protein [Dyadobacter crusticola]